jgi:hypothetical protein
VKRALFATALTYLIVLHDPHGRGIAINAKLITHLLEARDDRTTNKHFAKGLKCMVNMVDGKFIAVIEECQTVRQLMKDEKQ